jgi:hypothetical protein
MLANSFPNGVFVMVGEAKPPRSVRIIIAKRAEANLCLHCDNAPHRRGLCDKHYARFRKAYNAQPKSNRKVWEVKQIRAGKVLESRQGKSADAVNEFED